MLDRRWAKISFWFNFFLTIFFVDTSQARPDVKASFSPITVRQCSCNVFIVVAVVLFVVYLWPKIKLVPLMTSLLEFPMRLCELEKLSSRAIFNRIKNGVAAERQFCCQNKKIWLCYFIKHCKIMQFDFSVVERLLFDV